MFRIQKEFHFSASHQLAFLVAANPDHQCARLHGHNYVVSFELRGHGLNPDGFVRDYGELTPLKRLIDDELDHRHLNEVIPFIVRAYAPSIPALRGLPLEEGRSTTAERMAFLLFHIARSIVPEVAAVTVSETPKTTATYAPMLPAAAKPAHFGVIPDHDRPHDL